MEKKVIVIGGGWSGIAAAVAAKKCGADVTIVEKTDLMLGLGNVGGIMRNNGRFTAAEEISLWGLRSSSSSPINIRVTEISIFRDTVMPACMTSSRWNPPSAVC